MGTTRITSFDQLVLNQYYTYQDYMSWEFKERVELLLGKVFKMSPAPNVRHQTILRDLFVSIVNHLTGERCQSFCAPFDVRLPISLKQGNEDTVVQPDICVVCDPTKLDEQGCNGAPDVVIEILSPGNSRKEMKEKFELYEASLVKEYWIVDPANSDVVVYSLNDENQYVGSKPYVSGEIIITEVLKGIELDPVSIF